MSPAFRLPEIRYPLSLDSIGKKLALGYEISAYCDNDRCHHGRRLNLVKIVQIKGMDFEGTPDQLRALFYCQPCREAGRPDRSLSFRLHPPTDPASPVT